jgi:hypothetical protein
MLSFIHFPGEKVNAEVAARVLLRDPFLKMSDSELFSKKHIPLPGICGNKNNHNQLKRLPGDILCAFLGMSFPKQSNQGIQ